jgi:hypothetical protein
MPANTTKLAIPYPLGTDLLADGDNAIQASAVRLETVLTTPYRANLNKSLTVTGFKPSGSVLVPTATATLTMAGSGGLALVRMNTDISSMTGSGFVITRIGVAGGLGEDSTQAIYYESGSGRAELASQGMFYVPVGATTLSLYVQTFANPASGISVNSCRWGVFVLGGTSQFTLT